MPIHKLIQGGEKYLPFALSKLRELANQPGAQYASRNYLVDDGSWISIRTAGDQQYVRITGGVGYEFFMPQPISVLTQYYVIYGRIATQDPALTGDYAVVAGSGVKYVPGIKNAYPVFSETLAPSGEGPQWPTRPIAPLYLTKTPPYGVVRAHNFFQTWASWQNQKGAEFIHYPGGKGDKFVTSARGFGPGIANQAGWHGYILFSGFAFWDYQLDPPLPSTGTLYHTAPLARITDVGKDVAAAYYEGDGVSAGAPELPDHIDWRRAAVYKADGGRKFFVMHDTHGRFHVYPVKKYFTDDHPTWETANFKTYTPPYPAWVTVPGDSISRSATRREYVFTFNKDASKIVGVPFKEEEGKTYTVRPSDPLPANPRDDYGGSAVFTKFFYHNPAISSQTDSIKVLTADEIPADFTLPYYEPCYWHTPGLVEFGLSITVNGSGDLDFEAEFTLLQSSFYNDDFRYYVDAGYLMGNRGLKAKDTYAEVMLASEGDLLTAEIELHWKPPETEPGETAQTRIGRNVGGFRHDFPGGGSEFSEKTSFELSPHLPADPSIQQAAARCSQWGPRHCGMVFYTVRKHATQEIVRRFMLCDSFGDLPGSWNNYPGVANIIHAADIRSLSYAISTTHVLDNKRTESIFAWNELKKAVTTFAGDTDAALADCKLLDGVPAAPYIRLPFDDAENSDVSMFYLQMAAIYLMQMSWFSPLTAHPHGHWSCGLAANIDTAGDLDIIQAVKPNGDLHDPTSHRKEYNKAFGQNRLPGFHGTSETDSDLAPMATTGIWKMA